MEFFRAQIRRSRLGELAYLGINALLPFAALLLVYDFDSAYPALALILLSKWRIIALRPRFWWASIKANAVDMMVGVSFIGILWFAQISLAPLALELAIAVAYAGWLLYLKPRSSTSAILAQAGVAQFLALTVLFNLSTTISDFLVIAGCWVIGYASARHVVSNQEEESVEFLSSMWGLLIAQLGWLAYFWTGTYDLGLPVKIPQVALLALVLSFASARLYTAVRSDRVNPKLIRVTILFAVVLLAIILIFSRWDVTI